MSNKYKIPYSDAKLKVYDRIEFRDLLRDQGRRQERLVAAILDNREDQLSPRDQKYLEVLKAAFKIMSKDLSPLMRRKKVQKILGIEHRGQILKVMKDVEAIFCDVDEQTRALDKVIFEHRLSRLIQKIEKADIESPSLPRLYTLLAKVQGHDIHEVEKIDFSQLTIPVPEYTNDPNALDTAEDISHEEINE